MDYKYTILLVEDDTALGRFISTALLTKGYKVVKAEKGEEAISLFTSYMPDLIILDLGLPDIDGLEVIDAIRKWSTLPIIVVSARGRETQKVEALDRGADDYLTKPFGVEELQARIRVAFRHMHSIGNNEKVDEKGITIKDLHIDMEKRRICIHGEEIHFTPREYKLMVYLAKHAGRVITHKTLLREIWGPNRIEETQYIRVFMANMRRKIEKNPSSPEYIQTEVGVGYRMVEG